MIEPVEATLVHDEGLDPASPALVRRAVRAVARRGDQILLMGTSSGAWKFPGGGIEDGEGEETALRREVDEECGLAVTSVDGYVGEVVERSAAHPGDPRPVFVQVSRYHACTLGDGSGVTTLSDGERARARSHLGRPGPGRRRQPGPARRPAPLRAPRAARPGAPGRCGGGRSELRGPQGVDQAGSNRSKRGVRGPPRPA